MSKKNHNEILLSKLWEYNQQLKSPLNIYYIEPVIGDTITYKYFLFTSEVKSKENYKDNKELFAEKIFHNVKKKIFFLYRVNDKKISDLFYRELLKDVPDLRGELLESPVLYGNSNGGISDLSVLSEKDIIDTLMKIQDWGSLNNTTIQSINGLCKNKNINKKDELDTIKLLLEKSEKSLNVNIHFLKRIESELEKLYSNDEINYLFSDLDFFKDNINKINEGEFSSLFDKNKKKITLTIEDINIGKIKKMFNIPGWSFREYSNLLSNYARSLTIYDINLNSTSYQHESATLILEFNSNNIEYSEKDFTKDLFDLLVYCKENYKIDYSSDIIASLVLSNKLNKNLEKKENVKSPVSKL